MIDLILQGTKANIASLLVSVGLATDNGDGTYTNATGFDWFWWRGDGKFPDGNGGFVAGFVMLARIATSGDEIPGPQDGEQWSRSQVARYIKTNGTLGTFGGLPCYTLANVRLLRPTDVFDWLAAHGFPGHEWLGGNAL